MTVSSGVPASPDGPAPDESAPDLAASGLPGDGPPGDGRPGPVRRRRRFAVGGALLFAAGFATAAAVAWVLLAPHVTGRVHDEVVRYPGTEDPRAAVQAAYVTVAAVAGLLTGTVALGLGDRGRGRRCLTVMLAAFPLAGLMYLVGFLLGPPTEAAQIAHGADRVDLPFVLSTPLLILVWPMVASMVVAVGMLLSLIVKPPARRTEA